MITKYVKGSILDTECMYIAHGVNCQNVMGAGVAKVLYEKYPKVKEDYHRHCAFHIERKNKLLGGIDFSYQVDNKLVVNCFTQDRYGSDGKRYVNYSAIVDCFKEMTFFSGVGGEIEGPIAIPKIGCGWAGGNWEFVEQLINDTVGDQLEIWVYEL